MMTFDDFIKDVVKIEYLEEVSAYGHHPFQLLAVKGEHNELNSLCRLKLKDVAQRVNHYLNTGYADVYVSLDFPKNNHISNDFVLVIHISNGKIAKSTVIEYDVKTGELINKTNGESHDFLADVFNLLTNRK